MVENVTQKCISKKKNANSSAMPIFFLLFVFCIDGSLLFALEQKNISLQLTLWIHLALLFLIILWTYYSWKKKQAMHFPLLLLTTFPFLGGFSALGCFLSFLAHKFFMISNEDFEKWHSQMMHVSKKENQTAINIRHAEESLQRESFKIRTITPFIDVLFYGNAKQKQEALIIIAKNQSKSFIPILKCYLKDHDLSIKVLATSLLGKIGTGKNDV